MVMWSGKAWKNMHNLRNRTGSVVQCSFIVKFIEDENSCWKKVELSVRQGPPWTILYSRPRIFLLTRSNGIQIPDGYFDGGDVFDVVFAGWN